MQEKKDNKSIIYIVSILLVIVGLFAFSYYQKNKPGKLDGFAQCLKDSGAQFYGAFWCPHCQTQKKLFGSSARLLPYTECSTPDGSAQTEVCKEAGIKGYPTWTFKNASTTSGEVSLDTLAENTSCELPKDN